jgi:hypothetical protein
MSGSRLYRPESAKVVRLHHCLEIGERQPFNRPGTLIPALFTRTSMRPTRHEPQMLPR